MWGNKEKHCWGMSTNFLFFISLLTAPSNVLPLHLKQTFPPIIWIFTEGDGIKSRLPFEILSTLLGIWGCYHALDIRDNLNLQLSLLLCSMHIETTLKWPKKKYEKGSGPCEMKAFKMVTTRLDLIISTGIPRLVRFFGPQQTTLFEKPP